MKRFIQLTCFALTFGFLFVSTTSAITIKKKGVTASKKIKQKAKRAAKFKAKGWLITSAKRSLTEYRSTSENTGFTAPLRDPIIDTGMPTRGGSTITEEERCQKITYTESEFFRDIATRVSTENLGFYQQPCYISDEGADFARKHSAILTQICRRNGCDHYSSNTVRGTVLNVRTLEDVQHPICRLSEDSRCDIKLYTAVCTYKASCLPL